MNSEFLKLNMKMIFVFLTAIIVVVVSKEDIDPHTSESQVNSESGPTVCAKSLPAGEMATCAGTALTRKRISYHQFEDYLHQALAKIPSDKTYYAMGWQSSKEPGLLISKQSHYSMDWSKRIPLDPRETYNIPEIILASPI